MSIMLQISSHSGLREITPCYIAEEHALSVSFHSQMRIFTKMCLFMLPVLIFVEFGRIDADTIHVNSTMMSLV